ncbi:hypothetical protein FRC11_008251 [Ceratobasidium sp. 423]|nr:hypothetical protein FRC11_008251 [Ceratobasidium sp. 423]
MSGKEHQVLETVHLSVVVNSPAKYSCELTLATHVLLNMIYWAQLQLHTTATLEAFKASYAELHKYTGIWIKNRSQKGEKGNVIPHFNIPKFHMIQHLLKQILAKGTANNFSMETIEHMHMDTLKEAFLAMNKKDWEKQTIRWKSIKLKHESQPSATAEPMTAQYPGKPLSQPNVTGIENSTNESLYQHQRGGFALRSPALSTTDPVSALPKPLSSTIPQKTRKQKHQIDDEDISEERTSKCIVQSQLNHGLLYFQDIALVPSDTLTMAEVQDKYELPNLLHDCKAGDHPFVAMINCESRVQVEINKVTGPATTVLP